jgi:hypothetical protein
MNGAAAIPANSVRRETSPLGIVHPRYLILFGPTLPRWTSEYGDNSKQQRFAKAIGGLAPLRSQ